MCLFRVARRTSGAQAQPSTEAVPPCQRPPERVVSRRGGLDRVAWDQRQFFSNSFFSGPFGLSEEQQRHDRENLTEEELVIFDILTRPAPELSDAERAEVKKVSHELLNKMKLLLVLNWRQKSTARSQLKLTIEKVLDTLPPAYDRPLYAQKCSALFEHVFESYPERDAGVYSQAV